MRATAHRQWVWAFVSLVWENSLALSGQAAETHMAIASNSMFHTLQSKTLVDQHQETQSRMPPPPKAQKQPGHLSKGSKQID